ncbi:hypothetical protein ASG73_00095 [Janibacter sp. Soil728]|nr:hypothetical protein ASG73_00095 [Janibacter sp. Soil728]
MPPFAVVAALGLMTAACGGETTPPTPSTVTVTQTPTEQTTGPERRQLTTQQVTAALPTKDDVPAIFRPDSRGFDTSSVSERTTDPASCLALYMATPAQRTFTKEHLVADGGVRFSEDPDEPGSASISVGILSYDEPYPREYLDEAGAVLGECSTFTSRTTPDSAEGTWQATTISTPTLGDQSFGVRIGSRDIDLAIDYLWVRSGHNVVHVRMLTGYRQDNGDQLKTSAQGVLDDLAATP